MSVFHKQRASLAPKSNKWRVFKMDQLCACQKVQIKRMSIRGGIWSQPLVAISSITSI